MCTNMLNSRLVHKRLFCDDKHKLEFFDRRKNAEKLRKNSIIAIFFCLVVDWKHGICQKVTQIGSQVNACLPKNLPGLKKNFPAMTEHFGHQPWFHQILCTIQFLPWMRVRSICCSFLLSFPQNERKIFQFSSVSFAHFVYYMREVCLLFNF